MLSESAQHCWFVIFFSVCLTLPGTRLPSINARKDSTPKSDDTPLSVEVDVASVHFRGEKAEFFILTTFKGSPVTVTDLKISPLLRVICMY